MRENLQNYKITLCVTPRLLLPNLKGHYRHDQSRLSTGHGIGVPV